MWWWCIVMVLIYDDDAYGDDVLWWCCYTMMMHVMMKCCDDDVNDDDVVWWWSWCCLHCCCFIVLSMLHCCCRCRIVVLSTYAYEALAWKLWQPRWPENYGNHVGLDWHHDEGRYSLTCPIMTYDAMKWYHMHIAYWVSDVALLSRCCHVVGSSLLHCLYHDVKLCWWLVIDVYETWCDVILLI